MRDKLALRSGEASDLDRVFLQLDEISVRFVAQTGTREVEMVGAESSVPIWELFFVAFDDTRDGARGDSGAERDEEEVSFFGALSDERAVLKRRVEE